MGFGRSPIVTWIETGLPSRLTSILTLSPGFAPRIFSPSRLGLAVLVAAGALVGYALVLRAVGLVSY